MITLKKKPKKKKETLHSDKELKSIRRRNYTSMYTWIHPDAHTYLHITHSIL